MFKHILSAILFIYSTSTLIIAQELKTGTKESQQSSVNSAEETTSTDNLLVKDSDANVLMQINDEGSSGSITLPSLSTIGTSSDKLYNIGSSLYWNGSALGTAGSAGGWTDDGSVIRLSLNTDKVGIGTTVPTTALHVTGNDGVLFEGTYHNGTALSLGAGTRMMWYPKKAAFRAGSISGTQWDDANIGYYSTAMGYNTTASGYSSTAMGREIEAGGDYSFAIALNDQNGTNVTQANTMAIMGGKVGIGTANPYSKLAVGGNGLSTATIYGFNNATSGNVSWGWFEEASNEARAVYGLATSTSGTTYGGTFNASNSPNGTGVWASGGQYDFWAHSGTYGNSSSIRWKRNIVEIDNPLRKIAEIRGVYFDWDEEHGNKHSVGFIAEEVGKLLPEIVFYEENGIDAKGMDYPKITPLLVEAVKALVAENDKLKQRLEALENKLNK